MTAPAEPQLIPVNGIFADDYMEALVPLLSTDLVREAAEKVAYHSEGKRVRKQDKPKVVFHHDTIVDPDLTVVEAGIAPLDHIRVDYED